MGNRSSAPAEAECKVAIPRVFPSSADYRVEVARQTYVFFEDSRPDAPAGTTIAICLPGIGDTRRQFRLLAPLLHDRLGFRVLLGDLRGFGDSTSFEDDTEHTYSAYSPESVASDVTSLMEKLGAADPTCSFMLLGNSLSAGSMVLAAAAAAKMAETGPNITAVALLGPILRDSPMDVWFRPLSHLLFRPLYGASIWASYYKTLYPGKIPSDFEAELEILRTHLKTQKGNIMNVGRFVRASKAHVESSIRDLGKQPALHVLAFFGKKDPDYANIDAEMEWFTAAVPHARLFTDDEGGHYPHLENPERVITAIAESFLGK
ncbi:unnamed protein product [Phytophthora fragariaefolia]|uniref:Unnamed protein product n=1 Tax=Phytophthora fragariaefolia TaxID=1490495 RepID=A0A9W6X7Z6_9STRA|nr:unnamed protein product [Phytophthora fragariaefolia]